MQCGDEVKSMREKLIEEYFVREVKKVGIGFESQFYQYEGLPDRMVLLPNGVLFFCRNEGYRQNRKSIAEFRYIKN